MYLSPPSTIEIHYPSSGFNMARRQKRFEYRLPSTLSNLFGGHLEIKRTGESREIILTARASFPRCGDSRDAWRVCSSDENSEHKLLKLLRMHLNERIMNIPISIIGNEIPSFGK